MAALDLFFSYSHRDEPLRAELEKHLALMQREGLIRPWHDLRIDAGSEWKKEIHQRLECAHLILLLISSDFMASPYCYDIEMKRAIERHDAQEARVVPILLRPCDWQSAPFGKLQALPSNGEPVSSWKNQDAAFTDIAQGLRRLIGQVQEWQELDDAYEHRAMLVSSGGDTTEIDTKILDLKRHLRQGGRLQPGDIFADRYKLQKLLGQGGFATVWRAYDRERQELVAIKVLHAQYAHDRSRRDRFFRGARQMARLRDLPGIVDIVEREGHDDGFHFYVMEYVAGGDFRQAVLSGRLSIEERLEIILDIGKTLHAAHERGVIHRDVKPANILLDRQGRPKLTDFDLVRAADTTGGTRTSKLGTFIYAAPEAMMDASRATESADVYGLAMTAIFAVYGEDLPEDVYFEQEEFLAGLKVDDALRAALARGVARKVKRRWVSVEELCAALESAANAAPQAAESSADIDRQDKARVRPRLQGNEGHRGGQLTWGNLGTALGLAVVLVGILGIFAMRSSRSPESQRPRPADHSRLTEEAPTGPQESTGDSSTPPSSEVVEGSALDQQPRLELSTEARREIESASPAATRPDTTGNIIEVETSGAKKQSTDKPDAQEPGRAREDTVDAEESGTVESQADPSREGLGGQRAPEPGELWTEPTSGMRFRYVPAGTFQMGSPPDEPGRSYDEKQHDVTLTRGFWLGETEVTQGQWRELMNSNPSRFGPCGDECPVERVNWFEAVAFANALSEKAELLPCYKVTGGNGKVAGDGLEYDSAERIAGCTGFRLPTEAEWERAARADTSTAIHSGDMEIVGRNHGPALDPIAWYGGNSAADYVGAIDCSNWPEKQVAELQTCGPQPVAGKRPNAWQLHDMLGGVHEWCEDWLASYPESAMTDPVGPEMGSNRVFRGGSWGSNARLVRAAYRGGVGPGDRFGGVGFRLARGQVSPEGR